MPNHVTNIIELSGDKGRFHEMLTAIQNDEYGRGSVDFNKIIPMPESLNIEASSSTDRGLKAYKGFIEVYTLGCTVNMDKLKNIRHSMLLLEFPLNRKKEIQGWEK